MNNKSNIIIGAIAVIALLGVVLLALRPASTETVAVTPGFGAISNTNAPAAGTVQTNGNLLPNPSVYDYTVARSFLYFDKALGYGNATNVAVLQQGVRQAIVASTSIDCYLQNPFTATSTYEFSANISSTSASGATLVLSTASNTGASTTNQGSVPYSANAQLSFSTQGTTTTNIAGVVGPSQYLTLGALAGGGVTLAQLGGSCSGIFTSTQ